MDNEFFLILILDIALTSVGYLLVPIIYCLRKKPLTAKRIKKIIILHAIIVWLVFQITRLALGDDARVSVAVWLWSLVGYEMMKKHLLINKESKLNTNITPAEDSQHSVSIQSCNDEENNEQKSENQKPKLKQCKRSFFNMPQLKKYPLVFCMLLCVILYLLFLTIGFTETSKRDTYICYTTKTGTHFHAPNCKYLNTAYETTVYEASKKYKPCSYCNPFTSNYKTTITVTERDYLAPAIISIPISAVIYLIVIKKDKAEGDDNEEIK